MYYTLYELLSKYIYGAGATLTGEMELTLTFLSTLGSIFVTALPFLVVYLVIRSLVIR